MARQTLTTVVVFGACALAVLAWQHICTLQCMRTIQQHSSSTMYYYYYMYVHAGSSTSCRSCNLDLGTADSVPLGE